MAQYSIEHAAPRAEAAAPAIANPAPLGLSAFALTTFVLSAINAGLFPAAAINIIVAPALFYGGIAQILAGMWEFRAGNTFGATAFTSYGAFWLAVASVFVPVFGIYDTLIKAHAFHPAFAFFLLGWTIFTFVMLLGTFRSTMALIAVFAVLFLTFLSLTIGEFSGVAIWGTIGGWLGLLTAILAWYTALAGLLSSSKGIFTLPVGPMS